MHSGQLCAVSSELVAVLAPVPTGNVKVGGGGAKSKSFVYRC